MFKKIIVQTCYFNLTEESASKIIEILDDEALISLRSLFLDEVVEHRSNFADGSFSTSSYVMEDQKVKKT